MSLNIRVSTIESIYEDELDVLINTFGSLTGILLNKNISCVTFFMQLMKDEDLKEVMMDLGGCSWYDVVHYMTLRYPLLHKSKKVKRVV